jgi:hypothetical protein
MVEMSAVNAAPHPGAALPAGLVPARATAPGPIRPARPAPVAERPAKKGATLAPELALAFRATFEVIGFAAVVLACALALFPGLRSGVSRIGAGMVAPAMAAAATESADADDSVQDAPVPAAAPAPAMAVALEPAQANVATYLARRYHVADEAVRLMVAAARDAGRDAHVDPLLVLAVVAVESSMNPFAQSPLGATGLMQVMPDVHEARFVERRNDGGVLDPVVNIKVGTQILGEVIQRGGSIERGLQLYVGAGNAADDRGYAARVLAEVSRLKLAASGGIGAALAAGIRADTHASGDASDSPAGAGSGTSAAPAPVTSDAKTRKPRTA